MGIFARVKSPSKNPNLKSSKPATEDCKIIEPDMNKKDGSSDEREEGEIIDEFEDIISSDEEFSMRRRIEELEAKNAELEKIANISASAVYASGGYNDYPKKDSHHLDRYPLVSIDISDDEDYPPAPKMQRVSRRRKSMQHSSSSRQKLLHTSSSGSHRRRKRSSSPPPAPSYRQSDKLLLSMFHEKVASQNSHSSKRKRKTKKTHSSKSSRRKSREYYVSDTNDDYNHFDSYNVDDNSHERLNNTSDCDNSYSLNRDELRVALARNTHRIEQHASLKDRLTRKKENTNMFNFVPPVQDLASPQEVVIEVEVEEETQIEKPHSPVEEKPESDDNLEEQELRILALKSAVLKKHMVRKKRNENIAYSPSDFDEVYKSINESPSLNNIEEQETCNSMEISPVPSPKMILSDDGGNDTKPVDMDIANSDSECELPSYDEWIPIEQIPLPNSIEINEEIYNPTPMRYNNNNNEQIHLMPPDVRYESASVSPKNFDSEVDEEELALRALLLAKMNSPKVNKNIKEPPPRLIKVQTPDPDVSMEAEVLRNFLIDNMKKKAKPQQNSSASVLKEAVRRLTGRNASASPIEISGQNRCPVKTADETETELSQAITEMAKVNIGIDDECKSDLRKKSATSGLIRVRNIESLRAPLNSQVEFDAKIVINQENKNFKEKPASINHPKTFNRKEIESEKASQPINSINTKNIVGKKENLPVKEKSSNNVLKSVSNEKNKTTNASKPKSRNLVVKIEKTILTQNVAPPKPSSVSKKVDQIENVKIECQIIAENSTSQPSKSDVIESNKEDVIVDTEICVKIESEQLSKDQINQNGSQPSKSVEQIASKTVVGQKQVVPKDDAVVKSESASQTSKTVLLDQVSIPQNDEDLVPKQAVENLTAVLLIQNKQQDNFAGVEETMSEVVKDVDPKAIVSTTNLEKVSSLQNARRKKDEVTLVEKNSLQTTDINSDIALKIQDVKQELSEDAPRILKEVTTIEIVSTNKTPSKEDVLESVSVEVVEPKIIDEIIAIKALEESPSKEVVSESISEENVNLEPTVEFVDLKDIEQNVMNKASEESPTKEVVLEPMSEENINLKETVEFVDPKDIEKSVMNKAFEESPNKEIVLDSISLEQTSKSSPTKVILEIEVDPIGSSETVISQSLSPQDVNVQKCDKDISSENIIQEINSGDSTIEDSTDIVRDVTILEMPKTAIDINSNTNSKSEVAPVQQQKEVFEGPKEFTSKLVDSTKTDVVSSQVKLGTKSIKAQIQKKQIVEMGNQVVPKITQNISKLPNIQKVTETPIPAKVEKTEKLPIKSITPTQRTILPSTSIVVGTQKPIAKLPTQQPIPTRTKIVKPNKVINQQPIELKRKTIDNLPQTSVPPTKKPKLDDTNRLITTADIPKVPELIIQLRASESESEYSELSAEDMEEDEDARVENFFNRSITIGNEYYDIASPISLPMESPCDTPTQSGSPIVSRTQTPQPPVEKSIVNDYFEAKLEQFLKNVRSKVTDTTTTTTIKSTLFEGQEIVTTNSTPVAVRHLPEASQQEYRRLINRMKMLERQKQAKNLQVLVKTSDAGAGSDSRPAITDGDSKFLVRKVLVKNATAKPPSTVIQKPISPAKTEKIIDQPSTPPKSIKSPQKPATSPVSQDAKSKENLLVLYENSYRKTGASIISSLDKSIQMVLVAKEAKMGKLKYEQRLRELRKEMDEVQKNLKTQQEKITKIYPEICNSHQAIESLKTRRTKINKAVTALGKSVIGPNYSMKNDQKSIISEKSKKLAAEIKLVNNMKLSDVELMEDQKRLNLPEKAKAIVNPAQQNVKKPTNVKLPAKSLSVVAPPQNDTKSIETQMPANSLLEVKLPAHQSNMPLMPPSSSSSSSPILVESEVPVCDSESPEILNKSLSEEDVENHVNNTIVPEVLSNKDDEKASSPANGHEEALELEQPVLVVVDGDKDNINNNEQAPEQTNMAENIEEENGDLLVGSAKLPDYVSPLSHLRDERHINPNGVVCPYQLMGQCDDKDCKYMHLED